MPHLGVNEWEILLKSERPDLLQHLLRCPRCRRRLEAVFESVPDETPEGPLPYEWPGLELLVNSLDFGGERRRSPESPHEARLLFDELLNLPPEYRLRILNRAPRFHSVGVAELLLDAAQEASTDHPLQSHHLALIAVAVLEHLGEASTQVRRNVAVAHCLLGDAERRRGRFEIADDHLANAVHHLGSDPIGIDARARLCLVLGQLRQDQRRPDEAIALFERSRKIYEDLGQDFPQASASFALGALLFDENEPELALPHLWEAHHLAADDPSPYIAFAVLQILAFSLAECGRDQELEEVLSSLENLRERLQGPLDPLRLSWVYARIAWQRGDRPEALTALESVFLGLLKHPAPIEAARAGVELALWSLEAGAPPDRLSPIAEELSQIPPELLSAPIAAVLDFALHLPSRGPGGFTKDALESVLPYLAKAQWDPDLSYFPLAEPDLVVGWAEVPAQQRGAAATAAGVELDGEGEPRIDRDLRLISWAHEALTGVRIHLPETSSAGTDDPGDDTWPS